MKEYEVGKVVVIRGCKYKVVKSTYDSSPCFECAFSNSSCMDIECDNILFKEIKEEKQMEKSTYFTTTNSNEVFELVGDRIYWDDRGGFMTYNSNSIIDDLFEDGTWIEVDKPIIKPTEEIIPDVTQSAYWKEYFENYDDVKMVIYHEPYTTVILTSGHRAKTLCQEEEFQYELGFFYAYRNSMLKKIKSIRRCFNAVLDY